jgi:hypothetical protein
VAGRQSEGAVLALGGITAGERVYAHAQLSGLPEAMAVQCAACILLISSISHVVAHPPSPLYCFPPFIHTSTSDAHRHAPFCRYEGSDGEQGQWGDRPAALLAAVELPGSGIAELLGYAARGEEGGGGQLEGEWEGEGAGSPWDGNRGEGEAGPSDAVDPALEATLAGLQAEFSFPMDPFQVRALRLLLRGRSVVVCAPTGAGKTAIAEAAAIHHLAAGRRVIYTTPLKALSNQKLLEMRERCVRVGGWGVGGARTCLCAASTANCPSQNRGE